jgi:hypothetical protein
MRGIGVSASASSALGGRRRISSASCGSISTVGCTFGSVFARSRCGGGLGLATGGTFTCAVSSALVPDCGVRS